MSEGLRKQFEGDSCSEQSPSINARKYFFMSTALNDLTFFLFHDIMIWGDRMVSILIVEDDKTLNKNIALALETEGYSILSAECLAGAEGKIEACDLVLLDVKLPDGSGTDFCRDIVKKSGKPVIFLTSCDDENDIVRGLDCGGDDYITKPFRLRELLSRIKAILRRCGVDDLSDLELTAIEQKLLEYLMINRERFLTRDLILEYLWDSKGEFVNDNTLSVNISRLREKLKNSSHGQIVTKRGLGYKWTQQTN